MPRKIISKKNKIDELNAIHEAEKPAEFTPEMFSASIKESAGGSISASKGALVQSSELNSWLVQLRKDTKNPFIGKSYMVRAAEYETDDKVIASGKVKDLDKALEDELDAGLEKYDPNTAKSPEAEDRVNIRDDGGFSNKLIDHCLVMNVTRRLANKSDDEVMQIAYDELKNHHGDIEYVPSFDIAKSIEKARYDMLLLTNGEQKQLK